MIGVDDEDEDDEDEDEDDEGDGDGGILILFVGSIVFRFLSGINPTSCSFLSLIF